ncbi:putative amidohydrolase YhaA [Brevibacillus reuszeri]|uniref:Amidohydrolase YhaA n=1 Tax=Brevibacillus reuszeri TaxID=54915 RepID=A0A0K9YRX8_9BACL|nr:M20 family metallopeptidase [Brevibacillus reuszeri]KNB71478.1 peptidase M20 [Brevibacillus reuszeri]MED1855724.1 M20 family metallopeptidase [Brevibacillus reuszeri]GED67125.1 putative amidohydrolase YhaA [Brevibacillus reuszeri]
MEKLYELLDQAYSEMVEVRRYLHQHPELSFQEVKTPKYIAEYHERLGHEVRTGVGGGGVVATLRGGKPGKTVALRADFDALPIQEETDVPFKSVVDGVMHACGHDSHTATLLVLAKVLNSMKDEIEGNVVFIHQHAEEMLPGGAIAMIEDGCLEGVDVIFGQHIWSTGPVGTIEYRPGPVMAAADFFHVKIQGRGGHGAQPHKTKDSVVIGAQLVGNLQQIVSRRVDPLDSAVLSIGSFEAKNAPNVIADTAKLSGTVRTFKETTRAEVEQEIERIIKGTCLAGDVEYEFEYIKGYPATVNPKEEMDFVAKLAETVPGVTAVNECEPQMGGEDFAYYLQHVKGAFFFTGAQNPELNAVYPHHHPKFNIDEKGMLIAAKTLGLATLTYLAENK